MSGWSNTFSAGIQRAYKCLAILIYVLHAQSSLASEPQAPQAELVSIVRTADNLRPIAEENSAFVEPSSSTHPTLTSTRRFSREWFEFRGVSVIPSYRAEVFTNLRRGSVSKRTAEYLGSADSSITLDLSRMKIGRGQVIISAQSLHGRSINDSTVGAVQAMSNLDSSGFSKVVESYYSDNYFNGRVTIKVGRQYADSDFNGAENGANFLNSSYGLIPTIPMPTYPKPDIGVSLWIKPASWISVGGCVFKGEIDEATDPTSKSRSKGLFDLLETKLSPFGDAARFHGSYRLGVWQQDHSARNVRMGPEQPWNAVRNYGFYGVADHWFRRTTSEGQNQGPGLITQLGWAPRDLNEVAGYLGAGINWPGLFPQRRQDSVGLGTSRVQLRAGRHETIAELFYKSQLTKHLWLQPDGQWVHRPSGEGHSVLVFGMRLGLDF